jgi:hypothetical protein
MEYLMSGSALYPNKDFSQSTVIVPPSNQQVLSNSLLFIAVTKYEASLYENLYLHPGIKLRVAFSIANFKLDWSPDKSIKLLFEHARSIFRTLIVYECIVVSANGVILDDFEETPRLVNLIP